MVDIVIEANASDNSGLPVTLTASVTSNEPEDGLGDGDSAPDWAEPVIDQETGIITLQLCAERAGPRKRACLHSHYLPGGDQSFSEIGRLFSCSKRLSFYRHSVRKYPVKNRGLLGDYH